jgi:hypothetical protein
MPAIYCLIVVPTILLSSSAMAASIGPCRGWFLVNHDICISGDIVPGDAKILRDVSSHYDNGTIVFLNSRGGNVDEMLDMGDIISRRYFTTAVNNRGMCASACAVLFFSGYHAVIERNALLIWHAASINGKAVDDNANDYIAKRVIKWGGVTYGQMWFLLHSASAG